MHFDALTLACVTAELQQTVAGGRVQNVLLPDAHSVGLEIYARHERHYLLLSAQAGAGRVHLVQSKLRRGVERETPLLLRLRKLARDAFLVAVEQPDYTERLLRLTLQHAEHGTTCLVAEPMGRLNNLLLLDQAGIILECMQRVPASEHAQRVLLPGKPYAPPPPQAKLPPLDDGSPDYYARLAAVCAAPGKLWKALVEQIAGVSPTQGRELAWRVTGDAEFAAEGGTDGSDTQMLALAQTLQELWSPVRGAAWMPGVIEEKIGEHETVVGFAPYPLHFRGRFVPDASISAAIERYYAVAAAATATRSDGPRDAYAAARGRVATHLQQARRRLLRQLEALAGDEPAPGEPEQLRSEAEWLLALASQVEPGQRVLEVDTGAGTEPLRIHLDPDVPPIAQAERRFKTAAKLARAAQVIPVRRGQLQRDLAFVEQLEADLALAENQPEIAAVEAELAAAGLLPQRGRPAPRGAARKPAPEGEPRRYVSPEGFSILVGRNARQNEEVTFRRAHPLDRWLHVRDLPGSHVVIRCGGQPVSEATLRMAAQLAAYYSKARGERAVAVTVAERRFVSRLAGGRTGQVTLRNASTVTVAAELPIKGEG